ncbi:hypothetical protein [Streptomyces sp. NPDC051310]|uniref:hypothetical protein n=1 Tax=Streptomyces sp. NPDC051310 TaxID=3365649 RepID=UPI0037882D23
MTDSIAARSAVAHATSICPAHDWCVEAGAHSTHASVYVEAPNADGLGDRVLPASIIADEQGAPFIGFLDLDLTPEQTRARCAELRAHLDQVEALADQLDGIAPGDPAAETYSITAPGAFGRLINAEIYESDEPDNPHSTIAIWAESNSNAELDVTGAAQLIADLERFIPRLRALRKHRAAPQAHR